jgi:hypothetical protein
MAGDAVVGVQAGPEDFAAPVVISTVPWFALKTLFDTPPAALNQTLAHAEGLASSPIVTVNVWFDRPVMTDDFVGLPGRAFQWAFDKSRIVGEHLTHLSLVSSGAESIVALNNAELASRALSDLGSGLPRVSGAQVRGVTAVRERRATFSLSPAMPRRPGTATAIKGLLLAGDWIDTGLPATIESAVVAGHRAAHVARSA